MNTLLPCPQCRSHMSEYLQQNENNIEFAVNQGGLAVFKWTFDFHNDVNRRLNTKIFPLQKMYEKYKIKNGYTMI